MTKLTTLLMVALLLSPTLTKATARPRPSTEKTQLRDGEAELIDEIDNEESCEGVNKEECLIKRTLVAHIDYIYTQKPPPQAPKA
ncbi:Phytosulfokines 3 [Camellia lanceoleosa]|uniref:Phytosulfokines 3 n=1 Tax=Camellia lanceoleosa TaxID=1840588 RepID=A0ACC0GRE0_9ERIC|nr:Phytosulfokines 3 [Camellia lanceoleosa]